MENILSQDEVDALLDGLSDGEIESSEHDETEKQDGVLSYDLTTQDRIVRGRMPTLEIIGERFARLNSTSMSSMLNKMVDVSFIGIETTKFGEFMRKLPVPTSLHVVRMKPLRGHALFIQDSRFVFLLIDCFFGGTASSAKSIKVEGRDFTPIENRIIRKVVDRMLREWDSAWKPVYQIETEYVRSEINPQFASIVTPTDIVVQVDLKVEVEHLGGEISFCIPYSNIEPIRSTLHAGYQSDQFEVDDTWIKRLRIGLYETPVQLVVELGQTTILGKDLINLGVGDTIILNKNATEPLIAKVEGVPKFKSVCGVHKGNVAIRLVGDIVRPTIEAH